jgi:hypothetical protein
VSLREAQRGFSSAILADDSAAIHARILPGRFGTERHLQIYRNNVYAGLTDALVAVYPVIARLVGEDCFRGCGYHYVRDAPPTSGNLHDFGEHFPEFLSSFEPVRELAYLPDVARLEWAWHLAFHAADAAALSLDALAQVAPEKYGALRFALHPSARLLASDYPVLRIWQTNQPNADTSEAVVDLNEGAVRLLIARRDIAVEIEPLGRGEYALLSAFAQALPFADAGDAAMVSEPAFDLAASLQRRVQDQTIVGFDSN